MTVSRYVTLKLLLHNSNPAKQDFIKSIRMVNATESQKFSDARSMLILNSWASLTDIYRTGDLKNLSNSFEMTRKADGTIGKSMYSSEWISSCLQSSLPQPLYITATRGDAAVDEVLTYFTTPNFQYYKNMFKKQG